MADLIDRETVRLAYEKSFENDNHKIAGASAIHMQEHRHMLRILDKIPAVDAVEVVRCKDCRRYSRDEMFGGGYCDGVKKKLNDFCSYGERREDNG